MSDASRLTAVETAVQDIRDAVVKIARLEEKHAETREGMLRSNERIGNLTDEVNEMKIQLATMRADLKPLYEMRKWVISGALGVISIMGMAVFKLVVR